MARHRHSVNVRADGLVTVLGPLRSERRIAVAVLADAGSGMLLDAWSPARGDHDTELVGAVHAEIMRSAAGLLPGAGCEAVLSDGAGERHHVMLTVPDPHGDLLVLSVVVHGRARTLRRIRRRLREVSAAALTAGPTTAVRPVDGGWRPGLAESPQASPPEPACSPEPSSPIVDWFAKGGPAAPVVGGPRGPAPPAALPPPPARVE